MNREFMDCEFYQDHDGHPFSDPVILSSGLESAAFPGQDEKEIERLLHMVGRFCSSKRLSIEHQTNTPRLSSAVGQLVLS